MFCSLEEAINELKSGRIIALADSPNIEDECDYCCLAKYATTENIARMITEARGLVCISMSSELCDKIGLDAMASEKIKADKLGTPFRLSVDLDNGSTGVSAIERGKTARHIATGGAVLDDFVSPGHLMTLRAKPGLLNERKGHTEASVQLAKLCGEEAAVICECIKENGDMLHVGEASKYFEKKNVKLYSMDQLIEDLKDNSEYLKMLKANKKIQFIDKI